MLQKKYNYPALAYYAIGNHQYLIKDTKKIKTMAEHSNDNKASNFITSVIEQKELVNSLIFLTHWKILILQN